MAKTPNTPKTPEQRARERAEYLSGLLWHTGAFLIINVFFWVLDAWGEGGINWSFFITAAWGFALAFHALAYFIDGRQLEDRKTAEYLAEEKQREVSEN